MLVFEEEVCAGHLLLFILVTPGGRVREEGIILVPSFRSFSASPLGTTVSVWLYGDSFSSM